MLRHVVHRSFEEDDTEGEENVSDDDSTEREYEQSNSEVLDAFDVAFKSFDRQHERNTTKSLQLKRLSRSKGKVNNDADTISFFFFKPS